MIKKIWQDPVGSKIISVVIVGLLSLCYAKVKSVTEKVSFEVSIHEILEIKIKITYVVLSVLTENFH